MQQNVMSPGFLITNIKLFITTFLILTSLGDKLIHAVFQLVYILSM